MKRILSLMLLATTALSVSAVPAKRGQYKMLTLSDGTQVRAELVGDEYLSYYKTEDGGHYRIDPASKTYRTFDLQLAQEEALQKMQKVNADRVARMQKARRKVIGGDHTEYTGTKRGLIILVNFSDKKFTTKTSNIKKAVNGPISTLQRAMGMKGSVKDYFLYQSNGKFELDFDIAGPYTLNHPYAYYGEHTENSNDSNAQQMILDALKAADNDVDYSLYDWDGDGRVEQVYVMYAGLGEAYGGDPDTVWPHEWQLSASGNTALKLDDVVIDTYACGSELMPTPTGAGTQFDGIGTLCHEFSHCLGYPDMYDTNYKKYGMGSWDLLDQGSYNGKSMGYCPPNYSAYEKWYAGWIEPTELKEPTTVKGLPAQAVKYGQAFVIYNDEDHNEYYLLENRSNQQGDWDQYTGGSGLMIMHVDYNKDVWSMNNVNSCTNYSGTYGERYAIYDSDHERMTLFAADNKRTTGTEAGDLYPYNDNNQLTDTSTPAATLFQGTKKLMGKPITNITLNDDGTIDFDFMGGSQTNVITAIAGINATPTQRSGRIYSVDGRFMGKDLQSLGRGIYIVDGKKIVK